MQENKDPAIKLFGKQISLPSDGDELPSPAAASPEIEKSKGEEEEAEKEPTVEKSSETLKQDDSPTQNHEDTTKLEASPENSVNPKTPSIEEESSKSKTSKTEKDQDETTTSQEKPLKKPDKILPCPRCNSMDTKFCYYNNYNINQPRHFCKACQRYWTAGGTMRNVPVGAGRRKSKSSSSHYRHITISEALQAARIDAPNSASQPGLKTNGRILNFGLDAPICESMASVLNLADKKLVNGTLNGFHKLETKGVSVAGKVGEKGDDCSSGSSVTVSNSMDEGSKNAQEFNGTRSINGLPGQTPCFPTVPWAYPWNSAMAPPPIFCPAGFPIPFYPPPVFWNCGAPGPWNVPWLSPQSPSPSQKSPSFGPKSPLGKHSREGDILEPEGTQDDQLSKQKNRNGCVLVPKTLRIDDPAEAAKSSIWATLGIQNESITGGGMFKGFKSKTDEKKHVAEPSPVLRANPAALSRSLNFQESV